MTKPATANAYEYLVRALQLLEKPRPNQPHSWIQYHEAIDEQGHYVEPHSERAVAWCTIGVVKAVTHYDPDPDAAYRYCLSILNAANPAYIATGSNAAQPELNDSGSWELVHTFFERAINFAARFK